MFKETHPILGTRDILPAIDFYTRKLGFELIFRDPGDPPNYVVFRRDAVALHMQFQHEHEMGTTRLRFVVEDPDALFDELQRRAVECTPAGLRNTPWGTREFGLHDLDGNALAFYRHLTPTDKTESGALSRLPP
jgi:catechol 2,3-dioxygenase-like lactoylglutathione lyase family enzyme